MDEENEIDSVSSFIEKIRELKAGMSESEGKTSDLYFRGQETEFWDIEPSIFRNDMVSIEHKLMKIPLQKAPAAFRELTSRFDIMTKFQHYGMCTRLLDLTTNPLVALYFACQEHGKIMCDEMEEEKEPCGVVYFTDRFYSVDSTDKRVDIISRLASYDLGINNRLDKVLSALVDDQAITSQDRDKWLQKENVHEFIDIIQNNYMVIPTYSNSRLSKQSGVFLLTGMFGIKEGKDIHSWSIQKCKGGLKDNFSDIVFWIDGDRKKEILLELDLYNINEATLFPELEHQLNYIKKSQLDKTVDVEVFIKYTKAIHNEAMPIVEDNLKLNTFVVENLRKEMCDSNLLQEEYLDDVLNILNECMEIDWYKKSKTSSMTKMNVIRYLIQKGYDKSVSTHIASGIMAKINDIVKSFILKNSGGDES